jgi:hypothetical protein
MAMEKKNKIRIRTLPRLKVRYLSCRVGLAKNNSKNK